jgi:hypothetical protein
MLIFSVTELLAALHNAFFANEERIICNRGTQSVEERLTNSCLFRRRRCDVTAGGALLQRLPRRVATAPKAHARNSLRLSSLISIAPGGSTGARYWNASGANGPRFIFERWSNFRWLCTAHSATRTTSTGAVIVRKCCNGWSSTPKS